MSSIGQGPLNLKQFVTNGRKILGTTTNFKQLLPILNVPLPEKPTIFEKATSSYITEGQKIRIPEGYAVNQEAELGVIIGKKCKHASESNAMQYVGGYCLALDMTATSELKVCKSKGLPWTFGKGFDTATPVSRFIGVDEISDPHNVDIWSSVNGKMQQQGNTKDLIFSIPFLISFISKILTLEPNDLILTGTPPGMGPVVCGDVIEAGIGNLVNVKFSVVNDV